MYMVVSESGNWHTLHTHAILNRNRNFTTRNFGAAWFTICSELEEGIHRYSASERGCWSQPACGAASHHHSSIAMRGLLQPIGPDLQMSSTITATQIADESQLLSHASFPTC